MATTTDKAKLIFEGQDKVSKQVAKINKGLGGMLKVSGAVAAFWAGSKAVGMAKNMVKTGAALTTVSMAFEKMSKRAGISSRQVLGDIQQMSSGTISSFEAMKKANMAKMLGIPLEKIGELTEIARKAADTTGQSFEYMFNSIVIGLGRQSRLVLDNLGIVMRAEDAYKEYAASIGKTSDQLTENERKQAFINKALAIGRENFAGIGEEAETTFKMLQQITAGWNDFTDGLSAWISESAIVIKALKLLRTGIRNLKRLVEGPARAVGETPQQRLAGARVGIETLGPRLTAKRAELAAAMVTNVPKIYEPLRMQVNKMTKEFETYVDIMKKAKLDIIRGDIQGFTAKTLLNQLQRDILLGKTSPFGKVGAGIGTMGKMQLGGLGRREPLTEEQIRTAEALKKMKEAIQDMVPTMASFRQGFFNLITQLATALNPLSIIFGTLFNIVMEKMAPVMELVAWLFEKLSKPLEWVVKLIAQFIAVLAGSIAFIKELFIWGNEISPVDAFKKTFNDTMEAFYGFTAELNGVTNAIHWSWSGGQGIVKYGGSTYGPGDTNAMAAGYEVRNASFMDIYDQLWQDGDLTTIAAWQALSEAV